MQACPLLGRFTLRWSQIRKESRSQTGYLVPYSSYMDDL